MKRVSGIGYNTDRGLSLDLYLPDDLRTDGCVIFAHGDQANTMGHRGGEVSQFALRLTNAGFAVASVQYRLNATLSDFSFIDAQYIESFVARGRRIGLTMTPDLVGPEFIAAAEDISDAITFLRQSTDRFAFGAQNIGVLGVSGGGVAGLGLAYPPLQWCDRLARPDAVITIGSAMAQPWRLYEDGPPCLMFNSSADPIVHFRDVKMAMLRAEQVGTALEIIDTRHPGHKPQSNIVLTGADVDGRANFDAVLRHFAALKSDYVPVERRVISA